tara:strand:+ start:501 stop:752 length:252 start_codon:yes stop_codon:yes gene_type:complete
MGIGGISIWQLLIVLVIVLLLFGTKKLRNLGSDLGGAVKGFKSSVKDINSQDDESNKTDAVESDTVSEFSEESDAEENDSAKV